MLFEMWKNISCKIWTKQRKKSELILQSILCKNWSEVSETPVLFIQIVQVETYRCVVDMICVIGFHEINLMGGIQNYYAPF